MDIEVKIDKNYNNPKIIIYVDKVTEQISNIIDRLSTVNHESLKAYKDEKMYILKQNDIETIYTESGKVYAKCNNEVYAIKNRLYELEDLLDKRIFVRISNSEIANFNMVESIDFNVIGTLILNFKSGNQSSVSRRNIQRIKKFLGI